MNFQDTMKFASISAIIDGALGVGLIQASDHTTQNIGAGALLGSGMLLTGVITAFAIKVCVDKYRNADRNQSPQEAYPNWINNPAP